MKRYYDPNPLLEARDLSWTYNSSFALRNISFSLQRTNRIGIIGPNGAGKSTLLRLLLQIIRPPRQSVFIHGQDVCQWKPPQLARFLSYVPQVSAGSGHFTVKEIVEMGRYVHGSKSSGEDHQIVESTLKTLDLLGLQNRRAFETSGGEFQRVLLARALAQETDILLLDEPTNHLDLVHQLKILDILKRQQENRNFSILSVFHDINLAMDFCTHIMVMKQGCLVCFSTPEELYESDILDDVYQLIFTRIKDHDSQKKYLVASLR